MPSGDEPPVAEGSHWSHGRFFLVTWRWHGMVQNYYSMV
jgi:hypothetical protein